VGDVAELVRRYDVEHVSFIDANFFVDLERVRAICRGLVDLVPGIKWSAAGRAEEILRFDDELLDLAKRSGCICIGIGAESGSQQILDLIEKDISVEMLSDCAHLLRRGRLRSYFSFMIGLPVERGDRPPDDFGKTLDLVKQVKAINPDIKTPVCYYMPYPGSDLYDRALQMGFKAPESLEEWAACHWATGVHTRWVTREEKDLSERCTIFYFPLAYPDFRVKARLHQGRTRTAVHLLHRLAELRCRHDFYGFPLEWWAAKTLERLPGQKGRFTVSQF
jgi:anaerobic magnesium-protoporphyrin IX monomethyl ester cyclase